MNVKEKWTIFQWFPFDLQVLPTSPLSSIHHNRVYWPLVVPNNASSQTKTPNKAGSKATTFRWHWAVTIVPLTVPLALAGSNGSKNSWKNQARWFCKCLNVCVCVSLIRLFAFFAPYWLQCHELNKTEIKGYKENQIEWETRFVSWWDEMRMKCGTNIPKHKTFDYKR